MLGGFLVLNMIMGVVVENFQRCRERLEDEEKQRRRRKMLDKARSKNQQGGYYLPFALVVLRLQFQPLGIISYAIWPVCKSDLFRLPGGESTEA